MVFRDDDISYFTDPKMLKRLFGRLWRAGKPVVLGVVGEVTTPNPLPHLDGLLDPSVPMPFAHRQDSYSIAANDGLCALLTGLAKQGLIELAIHGWTHEYNEFSREPEEELRRRLTLARDLLHALAGRFPRSFIPPYESLSREALRLIWRENLAVFGRSSCVSDNCMAGRGLFGFTTEEGGPLLFCDDYLFELDEDPGNDVQQVSSTLSGGHGEFVVCALHSWSFASASAERWRQWDRLTEAVLRARVAVTTCEAVSARRCPRACL